MTWTAEIVEARLAAAARTHRASVTEGRGPAGLRSAMPDVVHDKREAYGWAAATTGPQRPSAAELSAMDAVMGWMSRYLSVEACYRASLPSDAGMIAWHRASARTWSWIIEQRAQRWRPEKPMGGNSRESLRQIARAAHVHVAARLTVERVPLHVGLADEAPDAAPVIAEQRQVVMPRQMDGRRMVLNEVACGLCAWIEPHKGAHRCRRGLGEVSPTLRARHPSGEACFSARKE